MLGNKTTLIAGWLILTVASFAVGCWMVAYYTPVEATMGLMQKIFYLHLPVAINTFLACMVCFVASVGYLFTRKSTWDDLAVSSARVAVLLCSIVLITGMLWAKGAWGAWWVWSPRLTFSLMLWMLYVVYLIVRGSIDSQQRRAVISAVYAVIAFLDVPLVYLSARLMPDIHPSNISLETSMQITLAYWFFPVTLAAAGLIVLRYALARIQSANEAPRGFEVEVAPSPTATPSGLVPGSPAWEALLKRGANASAEVGK